MMTRSGFRKDGTPRRITIGEARTKGNVYRWKRTGVAVQVREVTPRRVLLASIPGRSDRPVLLTLMNLKDVYRPLRSVDVNRELARMTQEELGLVILGS